MFRHHRFLALLSMAAVFLVNSASQAAPAEAPPRTMTLKEVVRRFVDNSPDIQAAQSQYAASHHKAKEATSRFFPNLSLNGSIVDYKNPSISSFPGMPTTGKQYKGTLDLTQPLFAGGAIWRNLQVAQLSKSLEEQTYLNTKQEALAGAISAALMLGSLREQIRILEESQKYQERFFNLTRNKAARGAAKSYELAQAKADFLSYAPRIEALRQSTRDAEEQLRVALKLEPNESISVAMPPLAKIERLDSKSALEQALKNRPKVKMAELGVEVAKESRWLSLSDDLPSLAFVASAGYQSPTQEDFSKETTRLYSVGLSLKVPLFSGLSSVHKYQSGTEKIRAAEMTLASIRNSLETEVQKAVDSIETAQRLIQQSNEWASEARRALNSSIDSYRIGVISSVQVIQVQRGWEAAEISAINSLMGYHTALLALRKAIGTDLEKVYSE